ncbi:uncharacterized protein RCO7_11380 [Rhynchosporium graminicola]|uniref:HTH psq-type domain-containing protein n=1 Tax=Rhynchosporium graminicola TaxID=2792576 RepID=A0A1E1LMR0_9HELO|nr:uncharacterized protein RCO7_11380 [Rhynchosporium commune]
MSGAVQHPDCCCFSSCFVNTTTDNRMNKASQTLVQGVPPDVPNSYRALADHSHVARSTLHHRACGRRSIEEKTKSQQYPTPWEEDVVVKFMRQMAVLGQPMGLDIYAFESAPPMGDQRSSGRRRGLFIKASILMRACVSLS